MGMEQLHAQAQRTRKAFLRAAAVQIGRRGYEAASFAAIAAEAETRRDSLRYHYLTKDEFADDILAYQFARWRQIREAVESSGLEGVRAIVAMQRLAARQFADEPHSRAAINLLLNASALPVKRPPPGTLSDWHPHFVRQLRASIAAGEVRGDLDPEQAAELLANTLLGRAMRLPAGEEGRLLELMRPTWITMLAAMGVADAEAVVDSSPDLTLPDPPEPAERNRHTRAAARTVRVLRSVPRERVEEG